MHIESVKQAGKRKLPVETREHKVVPVKEVCKKCFLPENFPGLHVSDEGICNFCESLGSEENQKKIQGALSLNKLDELRDIAERIKQKRSERISKYDCIIGASGGFDSTYVIYIAKKMMGLNPLVVKYDNGLSHEIATRNLIEACRILAVDCRIVPTIKNERGYIFNSTKALVNLRLFFSACFSCHYIIASVVYREAKEENLRYMLTSTNEIEKNLAMASHGFMLKSLIIAFLKCNPWKLLKFLYHEMLAHFYFIKLKFDFDGFSLRFFKNLFKLHPVTPRCIEKIDVSKYIAWNWNSVEKTLREELNWDTPKKMKIPYLRFDCHFSGLIDKSFKKVVGITGHGLLTNWFVQTGLVSKKDLEQDFEYMDSEKRVDENIIKALHELKIHQRGL